MEDKKLALFVFSRFCWLGIVLQHHSRSLDSLQYLILSNRIIVLCNITKGGILQVVALSTSIMRDYKLFSFQLAFT
jgi:hypothetical protein